MNRKEKDALAAAKDAKNNSGKKLTPEQNKKYRDSTGGKAARIGPGGGRGTRTGK